MQRFLGGTTAGRWARSHSVAQIVAQVGSESRANRLAEFLRWSVVPEQLVELADGLAVVDERDRMHPYGTGTRRTGG